MRQSKKIFRRAAALLLAAVVCFTAAGCGCNQAAEESSSAPGVGPSAGAAAGNTDNTPATSSTDGVNQMTTPEYGTTTAGGDESGAGSGPAGGESNAGSGSNVNGSSAQEDMTHSAGAVGGGTVQGYVPGTYTASAQGYAGPIEVTVEVDETHILSVTAVGENETPGVGQAALEVLAPRIAEENSTELDVVAGASFSSRGLLAAVEAALLEARGGQ